MTNPIQAREQERRERQRQIAAALDRRNYRSAAAVCLDGRTEYEQRDAIAWAFRQLSVMNEPTTLERYAELFLTALNRAPDIARQ